MACEFIGLRVEPEKPVQPEKPKPEPKPEKPKPQGKTQKK
jgi:hypothetical protein|nr:MAG TPA: hypothetical protein [Caudoviricetes sp.]